MRVPTELRLSQWLAAHLHNLQQWTEPQSGRIFDPCESHQHDAGIPAESYSPATALATVAMAARYGNQDAAALVPGYCTRIRNILASEDMPAFTALFVQYFGLIAADDLKALANTPQSPITPQDAAGFTDAVCAYTDRLDTPTNTNCAAMQAGVQMLRWSLRRQADWQRCMERLQVVASQQTDSGFINDDLAGPSMPVAYHMFSMYLLAAATVRAAADDQDAASPKSSEADACLALASTIVTRGYAWLGRLLANDGMIAQYGRSRYHAFAQAAGLALLAAAGVDDEDAAVRRYLAWMDQYRTPEPTSAFAVTANLCPPALRVGFESYATVSCYNNLTMTILLDAWRRWNSPLAPIAGAPEARRAFFAAAKETGCYGDAQTGLIRLRSRDGFVLMNLLTDYRGTTPAGSLMHVRLGDDLHEKASPPPFWADPRLQADAPAYGVWEGPLLCENPRDGCNLAAPPPFVMQGRALECNSTAGTLMLRCTGPGADWTKSLTLQPMLLKIDWQVRLTEPGQLLYACVPCLLWDGLEPTRLRFAEQYIDATSHGRTWRMTITPGEGQAFQDRWLLTPLRSLLSTSGVIGRLAFPLAQSIAAGTEISWTIRIEKISPQS